MNASHALFFMLQVSMGYMGPWHCLLCDAEKKDRRRQAKPAGLKTGGEWSGGLEA